MIICKDFDESKIIRTTGEWRDICPPEGGEKQWKDGRSAKELAKDWIKNKGKRLEILLDSFDDFEGIIFKMAAPEYESKFDKYKGKGRKHDLLVLAEDGKGDILISIEAKVDEPFGEIIKDYYLNKVAARINGISTRAPDRIESLLANVFNRNVNTEAFNLRYQLLHSIAGTVAESNKRNISRAIFIVNTFYSKDTQNLNSDKYQRNMKDLNQFIRYLSCEDTKTLCNNSLIGPFHTKDNDFLSSKVDLYIMKIESMIE